jgi:hypothetical protein
MRQLVIFTVIFLLAFSISANAGGKICSQDRRVVDPCYDFQGNLRIYADNEIYLNPVGTKGLLGIAKKSDMDPKYYWPSDIEKILDYKTGVTGNSRVCPFAQGKPEEVKRVCIDSATNLKPWPNPDADGKGCSKDKRVIGDCFDVHGLMIFPADMRPYLQPAGSETYLGIVGKSDTAAEFEYYWPSKIEKILDTRVDVEGDFRVCPFTPVTPSRLGKTRDRYICVDSAKNLKPQPNDCCQ